MKLDLHQRNAKWSDEVYCLSTVQKDGILLTYVNNQTDDICLAAVKQYGYALQYVYSQTDDICLVAVKQNGDAIRYVKKQTPAIMKQALQTTPTLDVNLINITQEEDK